MSKGKSELKDALKSLKVNKPLKLSKEIRFSPPKQHADNEPSNMPTPVGEFPTGVGATPASPPVGLPAGGSRTLRAKIPEEQSSTGSHQKAKNHWWIYPVVPGVPLDHW